MTNLDIQRLDPSDIGSKVSCSKIMANSEPWITLGRKEDDVLNILEDSTNETYLIKSEEELAGFAIVIMTGAWVGYIRSIVIKQEWRDQGVGTKALAFLEAEIFKKYPNVFLSVSSFNPKAKTLYLKLGYEEIGELKDYVIPGQSESIMRKTVGSLQGYKGHSY